jgi:hypothetical protein
VGRETQRVLKAEATLLRLLATWAPVHRDELPALFVSALTGLRHHLRHRHILRVRDDPAAAAAGTSGDVADTLFVSVHTLELVAARFQLPAAMSQTITRMVAAVPLVARCGSRALLLRNHLHLCNVRPACDVIICASCRLTSIHPWENSVQGGGCGRGCGRTERGGA